MRLADQTEEINNSVHHLEWGSGLLGVNGDTIVVTLVAVVLMGIIGLIVRSQLGKERPNGFVALLEMIIEFIDGLVSQTLGARRAQLRVVGPLAISLFIYLLVSNLLGLVPLLHSPTNDVNTTLALAIISITFLHVSSIRARGAGGYVKHYFSVIEPKWFPIGWLPRILFALLEVIQELSRPVTLTFRLYFNIFVGELLLLLILVLFPPGIGTAAQLIAGPVWIGFSIFVSCVQAFIFTMLTIAYVSMGTEVHDAHAQEHGDHDESTSSSHLAAASETS